MSRINRASTGLALSIRPPVAKYRMLDFNAFDAIIEDGYRHTGRSSRTGRAPRRTIRRTPDSLRCAMGGLPPSRPHELGLHSLERGQVWRQLRLRVVRNALTAIRAIDGGGRTSETQGLKDCAGLGGRLLFPMRSPHECDHRALMARVEGAHRCAVPAPRPHHPLRSVHEPPFFWSWCLVCQCAARRNHRRERVCLPVAPTRGRPHGRRRPSSARRPKNARRITSAPRSTITRSVRRLRSRSRRLRW